MPEAKSRKTFPIVAGSLAAVLAVVIFWQVSLNVGIRPTDSEQTILLFVLSTLVSLTFLVFGFILTRNILKLYIERRANQLGSKFKTKLVMGALALSLLPVTFLFYFSYVLTNRTLTRWFTQPMESVTRQTREIVAEIQRYAVQETEANASAIVKGPLGEALRAQDPEAVKQLLETEARRQVVDFLAVETASGLVAKFGLAPDLREALAPAERRSPRPLGRVLEAGGNDYAVAVVPVPAGAGARVAAWLVAGNRLPADLTARLAVMNREHENYNRLHRENRVLRGIYIAILALVTVIILFIATWVALFLSKQVTVPIQALAEATHQVSLGNLGHRIETRAIDELGALVRSFNDMMAQLEDSRAELERRRRETEAILESIPTAVISLSRDQRVLRVNPAVERMLGPERARGATLRELLDPEDLRAMEHLLRRALRQGLATSQLDLGTPGGRRSVAVTVSALRGPHDVPHDLAYIVVMEDISDLLHAQQEQAWREVAQRVAHEIKNPLTPIALSAERIRRHLERWLGKEAPAEAVFVRGDPEAVGVIADCAALIDQEVGTLKSLVDAFSHLARFPEARPVPSNLNRIVESALAVFDGRLNGIRIHLDLSPDLPQVNVDPDQFKQVIVNLVDNAAEAMEGSLLKELSISTALEPRGEFVEVVVADTGHGVSSALKEKLFLPYFSTKKRGTGLGLAIVSRILAEHRGSIRVEENRPVGARFTIELPV